MIKTRSHYQRMNSIEVSPIEVQQITNELAKSEALQSFVEKGST